MSVSAVRPQIFSGTIDPGPAHAAAAAPTHAAQRARELRGAVPMDAPHGPAGAPALPDIEGEQAELDALRAASAALMARDDMLTDAVAYDILQRAAQRQQEVQSELRRTGNTALYQAQMAEIVHTMAQIGGQRRSTVLRFGGSVIGVGGASAFVGSQGVSRALAELGPAAVGLFDQFSRHGGQQQSTQAQVALKYDALRSRASQNVVENARGGIDAGAEQARSVQQLIAGAIQRRAEVINNAAR